MRFNEIAESEYGFIIRPEETDGEVSAGRAYLALPRDQVISLAHKYFAELEQSTTTKFCRCVWAVHPDDGHLPAGHPKRRLRKIDEHPYCAVHTHIGRVVGFFDWLFKEDGPRVPQHAPGSMIPYMRADGTDIIVEVVDDETFKCTDPVKGQMCGTILRTGGECPNYMAHDHKDL